MKKSQANHAFFTLLFSLCVGVLCLGAGNSSSPVDEQPCSLARITDEQVASEYEQVVNQFQKSNKIRTGVKIGTYIASAAAVAVIGYEVLGPLRATLLPDDLNSCSLEQLRTLVSSLSSRVSRLELGPNLFSWDYCKSFVYSIIWSPSTVLDVTRILFSQADYYLNHVLYSSNLSWFIGEKTKLGLLSKRGVPATTSFEFEIGQLPKDIEKCAVSLDGVTRGLLPVDVAYQRRHMIDSCNMLVADLSKILAFIKYIDLLSTDEKNHFENTECTRYLINCTNSFCEGMENRLNGKNDEPFSPLVTAFNSELQPIMIRFAKCIK